MTAVSAKMIYDYAKQGDAIALIVNDIVGDMLARAIGGVAEAITPDRIVIGGGVMMAGQIIIDAINKHLPRYCRSQIRDKCTIVPAALGEDAGAIGAASMALDEF